METIVNNIPQIIAALSLVGAAASAILAFWATQRERRANVGIREATAAEKQAAAWVALLESYQGRVNSLEESREECRREIGTLRAQVRELSIENGRLQARVDEIDKTVNGDKKTPAG
jgi:chromosome segregation ATPase